MIQDILGDIFRTIDRRILKSVPQIVTIEAGKYGNSANGRVVASDNIRPRFKTSHWQLSTVNCRKDGNKK